VLDVSGYEATLGGAPTFLQSTPGTGRVMVDMQPDARDQGYATVVLADGKMLMGGWSWDLSAGRIRCSLLQLNADGSVDGSFGTNGRSFIQFTSNANASASAQALMVLPDGGVVVAGWTDVTFRDMVVAKITATGVLDSSFGTGGRTLIGSETFTEHGYALARQSSGHIIVVGTTDDLYSATTGVDALVAWTRLLGRPGVRWWTSTPATTTPRPWPCRATTRSWWLRARPTPAVRLVSW
jgi:uncharacterized delta-60 repeat protein